MPISALPASNTKRYKLNYEVGGLQHSVIMRVGNAVTDSTASNAFSTLLSLITDELWSLTVLGMEVAVSGSDIFNPATYSGDTAFGLGAGGLEESVRAASFTGRTATGRKSKFFIFGYKLETSGNARTTSAENGDIDAAVGELNSSAGVWLAIDGTQPVWHAYVNIDHNDHWVQKIRG